MAIKTKPLINHWYVNLTGQLIKVVAVGYHEGELSKVVIEYINGKRQIIGIDTWNLLDLEMHLYRAAKRARKESKTETQDS